MRFTLIAALVAAVTGCGPSFEDRFLAIEPGANRDSVIAELGEPDAADRFPFTHGIMGPAEALQGVVADGTEVEGLLWTRPAETSPDSVVFEVFLGDDGRVLATTHHGVSTVF